MMTNVRENAGLHEYDGVIQDLSPAGVSAGLERLGPGLAGGGSHDDCHLGVFEDLLRVSYGELEEHRTNPLVHLDNLDLSVYDREYAPAAERAAARRRHLQAWPDAVDMALESLDRIARATAASLVDAIGGLASGIDEDDAVGAAALASLKRLIAH